MFGWLLADTGETPTTLLGILGALLLALCGALTTAFKRATDRNSVLEDRISVDRAKEARELTEALVGNNVVMARVLEVLDDRERAIRSDQRQKDLAEFFETRRSGDKG